MTAMLKPPSTVDFNGFINRATRLSRQLDRIHHLTAARPRGLVARDGQSLDAALPINPPAPALADADSLPSVVALWTAAIRAELPPLSVGGVQAGGYDFGVDPKTLVMDPRDGAVLREGGSLTGLAITPHAFTQLVGLMLTERAKGTSGVLHHQLHSAARSLAFEDLREDSDRKKPVMLRTYVDPRTGLRTIRGVVSHRYPVEYFDDVALIPRILEVADDTKRAAVWRGPTETHGYAGLKLSLDVPGLEAAITWRNSEVGAARLSFASSLRIKTLDAMVVDRATSSSLDVEATGSMTRERDVYIAGSRGVGAINHTLPWKDWTEHERREEANRRIVKLRDEAVRGCYHLAAQWGTALVDFHQGFGAGMRDAMVVEVLMDTLEEAGRFGRQGSTMAAELRLKLSAIMVSETRLMRLPFGSAAHIAAAWACIARDAKLLEEQQEAQAQSLTWVRDGWRGEGTGVAARRAVEVQFASPHVPVAP